MSIKGHRKLKEERDYLRKNLSKLVNSIETNKVPEKEVEMLNEQVKAMVAYLRILTMRLMK